MMPLEPAVVRKDLGGSKQKRGSPQTAVLWFTGEQHRREPDPIACEPAPQGAIAVGFRCGDQNVPAIGNELLDFGVHARDQVRRASGKGDDNGFRILASKAKIEGLEPLYETPHPLSSYDAGQ